MKAGAQTLVIDPTEARDEAPRRRFPFRSAADLVKTPAPARWLVRDWFELASLVLFFGDAGSCKTWLALCLGMHLAAGKEWCGASVKQGAVFVIAGEGYRGLRRRVAGLALHFGIETANLPLYVSDTSASFTDRESIADVIGAIRELQESSGQTPVLIIVDTLSRNFGSADENSTADMAEFVRMADWIKAELDATVLVLHHVGHGDKSRARGNTTLRGALDVEYRIAKDEAGIVDVECTKAKDFEAPPARRYLIKNVHLDWTDEEGNPVTGAALVPTDAAPIVTGKVARGKNQTTALRILREAHEQRGATLGRGGYETGISRVSLQEWRELCEEAGIDRKRFHEVRTKLEDVRHVSVVNGFVFAAEDVT